MSKIIKNLNRITLLIVLFICLGIKISQAYSFIKDREPQGMMRIREVTIQPVKSKAIVTSNVLMTWHLPDGTISYHSFTNEEFEQFQRVCSELEPSEFNELLNIATTTSKLNIMSILQYNLHNKRVEVSTR